MRVCIENVLSGVVSTNIYLIKVVSESGEKQNHEAYKTVKLKMANLTNRRIFYIQKHQENIKIQKAV